MPNGNTYIPFQFRNKWYPTIYMQQAVLEDLARSGPFALKQQIPSATLTAKYKFKFLFGGNPATEQVVRDPCTQPTFELPGASTQPPRIQVTDPKLLGPHYSFKSWDLRRGYYSSKSIKRMSEYEEPSELFSQVPKNPGSTSGQSKSKKGPPIHSKENRGRGRPAKKRAKQKSSKKRRRRCPSESNSSTTSESSSNSERASSASSSS